MNRNKFQIFTTIGLAICVTALSFLVVERSGFLMDGQYVILTTALISTAMSFYVSFIIKTLNKNPTTFRAFIIGQPRAGKTVYLSVLFDELQNYSKNNIDFQPYGSETIEKVNTNLSLLRRGKWIPSTEINTAFFYRARASVGKGIFKSNYTVEIGDYAGEHIGEFDSSSEFWLHKTEYFKYSLASDALIFSIDGDVLMSGDTEKIEESQSMLIGAYQMLLTESSKAGEKFKIPVALVLLKSDLFTSEDEAHEMLKDRYARLIRLMSGKSEQYKEFLVSSVGSIGKDGRPIGDMKPVNVTQPMLWFLQNAKR